MCDTLPTTNNNHHINSVLNRNHPTIFEYKYVNEKSSVTEPDNGHKTETVVKPVVNADLFMESERLKTYQNWRSEAVTAVALAKAGFYSLNKSDLVKCAFCKAEICQWEDGDDPMEEHAKWSPNCRFVREQSSKNNGVPGLLRPGQDVCGSGELFPPSVPEGEVMTLLKNMIRSHEDLTSRLESFKDWPKSLKQKPTALAEAGFFYKGVGDQTICFECGEGLKNWEDNDDPWEQHALWFPTCKYLLSVKGKEFVDEVQSKFKNGVPTNTKEEVECKDEKRGKCEQGTSAAHDDSTKMCKICYNNEKEVVFLPCSHLLACMQCSLSLKDKKCPVCRKRIEGTIRVFPS